MYLILKILTKFICFLPLNFLYSVSVFITKTIFFIWKEKKNNIFYNYKIILEKTNKKFTNEEIKKIMEKNIEYYGKLNVEFICINKLAPKIDTNFLGQEYIREALKNGNGFLLATLHMGNWDLAGIMLASKFKPVYAIVDDLGGGYSEYIQKTRQNYGMNVILPEKNLKQAFLCLKNNNILNVLIDRPVSKEEKKGVEIEFFGKKARVATAAARIALATNSPVALGYCIRTENNFKGILRPPIKFDKTNNLENDIKLLTQKIFNEAEEVISKYPEQWYMFRRMWQE
jgi:KDO2-lipid IV(A) lauroyltransferase